MIYEVRYRVIKGGSVRKINIRAKDANHALSIFTTKKPNATLESINVFQKKSKKTGNGIFVTSLISIVKQYPKSSIYMIIGLFVTMLISLSLYVLGLYFDTMYEINPANKSYLTLYILFYTLGAACLILGIILSIYLAVRSSRKK